jgi:hypothetical protein
MAPGVERGHGNAGTLSNSGSISGLNAYGVTVYGGNIIGALGNSNSGQIGIQSNQGRITTSSVNDSSADLVLTISGIARFGQATVPHAVSSLGGLSSLRIASLTREAKLPVLQAPIWQGQDLPQSPLNYVEILLNIGFAKAEGLAVMINAWRMLFTLSAPQLRLFDHASTVLLASRDLPLRRALIGTGSRSPPWHPSLPRDALVAANRPAATGTRPRPASDARSRQGVMSVTVEGDPQRASGTATVGLDWGLETFATVVGDDRPWRRIQNRLGSPYSGHRTVRISVLTQKPSGRNWLAMDGSADPSGAAKPDVSSMWGSAEKALKRASAWWRLRRKL